MQQYNIHYTKHARWKLSVLQGLGIKAKDVGEALRGPDERLYDAQSDHLVAVRKDKNLVVVYDIEGNQIIVVNSSYRNLYQEATQVTREEETAGQVDISWPSRRLFSMTPRPIYW